MTLEKLKELRKLLTEYELQIDPKAREEERVIIQQANEVVHEDIKAKEEEKYSGMKQRKRYCCYVEEREGKGNEK